MKNKLNLVKKITTIALMLLVSVIAISCDGCNPSSEVFNNEEDALIFSSQEVDKVFNPFYSTSGADSNVVALTQISMLGNDKNGKVTYGDDEDVVAKDLEIITSGTEDVDQKTTYYFVLKNNVKFSNGSPLTMKDVLFNLYVYLDPAYSGSSTIYSTDIIGLKEYRTQASSEREQQEFMRSFEIKAQTRIDTLVEVTSEILEDHNDIKDNDEFITYLEQYVTRQERYQYVLEDYKKACELFEEELNTDYSNSLNSYEDTKFTDDKGVVHSNLFTTDVEVFLANEGYIQWNKKEGKLTSSFENDPAKLKTWTKEHAIEMILLDKIPYDIEEVVTGWATATELYTFLTNAEMELYFKANPDRTYANISGITYANQKGAINVNGVTYEAPQYNEDGSVKDGFNEVLKIEINDVDPKAIWNFAFSVSPMYYYSDEEHIEAFDYEKNFGVEYGSQNFMNNVIKNPDKIGVPVGAGPYAASKSSGGIENITSADFYSYGMIYYERNPYFVMGPAKIKKVRYQVVAANQMLNSLYTGAIDFVEPNAKPETVKELNDRYQNGEGFNSKSIQTAGYGYIGINAGKVPDMAIRQAIMHSINTQECVDYYQTTAKAIYRPMSLSSWAYPQGDNGKVPYYPYIGGPIPEALGIVNPAYRTYVQSLGKSAGDTLTEEEQLAFLRKLVEGAGYTVGGSGIYVKGSHTLKYTFTIAGQDVDHPAWQAMFLASEILNKINFQITVKTDADALRKLSSGELTVWAAAWGSTIDPDMYQVYHKDSNATSTLNWGYKQILQNIGSKYDVEYQLVERLSDLIDAARKTNDEDERAELYSQALDLVMQLAVELPTYQRDDLFAYNINKIDESTLTKASELSSFKGLTSDIHYVSLNTER